MVPLSVVVAAVAAAGVLVVCPLVVRARRRRRRFATALGGVLDRVVVTGDAARGDYKGLRVEVHRVRRVVTWEVQVGVDARRVGTLAGGAGDPTLGIAARRVGVSVESRHVARGVVRCQQTADLPRVLAPRLDVAYGVAVGAAGDSPSR